MITVPAIQMQQFGTMFYQAALCASDIRKIISFEVLSFGAGRDEKKSRSRSGINWEELEGRISRSDRAYQRPILKKKIRELVGYYQQRYENKDLPPVPAAVILVANQRLDFVPSFPRSPLGHLQMPETEGLLHVLDGHHRLLALAAYEKAEGNTADVAESLRTLVVPALVFDTLGPTQSVEMFVTVNTRQTKLSRDIVVSLSGRRLYSSPSLAAAHDIVRALNERPESPLAGNIRILGVGAGKLSQAPLADEIARLIETLAEAGEPAAAQFIERATEFFLTYLSLIVHLFSDAWKSERHCVKKTPALRAFIRVIPAVLAACREYGYDPLSAVDLERVLRPWGYRIGDRRFETDLEWRFKSAGGGDKTIELLAKELREALR
ncbi:MAG: DGQHR domain-containing protein [Planctomycetota bacterium]|nr:DGQHR domain-containing protein [Planctomycetota bacterium]